MAEINSNKNPSNFCNWIICPNEKEGGLIAGGYPYVKPTSYRVNHLDLLLNAGVGVWVSLVENSEICKYGDYTEYVQRHSLTQPLFLECPIPDQGVCRDSDLFDLVERVYHLVKNGKIIYVHCWGGHGRTGTFISCFLMRYYDYDPKTAIEQNKLLHSSRKYNSWKPSPHSKVQYDQVNRYRPPMNVIVAVSKDSVNSFRPMIFRVLKDLPPKSTIICESCRIVGEIASKFNLNVIKEEDKIHPQLVLIFHPHVIHSKETKDIMMEAYLKKIPVYVYDLKDKKKFEGDFKLM